ncbi:Lrp/AsnC family transcriptional regulator [Microbacterium sp. M3]|uniref:Lrp/AsnC family transcriptional regulator n=1 Tax=Microbacterium arthrosphaerae TaxID=792652 RepID=A0ABU4H3A2_9MICO|nr:MULTISPECIES: Lrp/AsnC family transcriptional regulator [Microbacterium]MDW4573816.1 Lrp/AsnC family transcriptional regulator [Microbacterium arthrosphaerae]MDW7607671.1 Lrp/AsnC family transcriptional regulator [Microbacterium sp. M3]
MDDAIDAGIVRAVSNDARATLADLSAAVGLSVSAVQTRLRRLEARGVITGYRALVDAEAVGKPLAAFVEITPLDPAQPDNAPELLEHLSEIEACHSIAGDASYMLLVRVATPRHLESLIRDIRAAASVNTRTTVVLQTFYENRPLLPA